MKLRRCIFPRNAQYFSDGEREIIRGTLN